MEKQASFGGLLVGNRVKRSERDGPGLLFSVDHHNVDIPRQLPNHLPASSAGRGESFFIGSNRQRLEPMFPRRHRMIERPALRTDGEGVTAVLDITGGIDFSGVSQHRCPDLEIGVWAVGILACLEGCLDETVFHRDLRVVVFFERTMIEVRNKKPCSGNQSNKDQEDINRLHGSLLSKLQPNRANKIRML